MTRNSYNIFIWNFNKIILLMNTKMNNTNKYLRFSLVFSLIRQWNAIPLYAKKKKRVKKKKTIHQVKNISIYFRKNIMWWTKFLAWSHFSSSYSDCLFPLRIFKINKHNYLNIFMHLKKVVLNISKSKAYITSIVRISKALDSLKKLNNLYLWKNVTHIWFLFLFFEM